MKAYTFRVMVEKEVEGIGENAEQAYRDAQKELDSADSVHGITLVSYADVDSEGPATMVPYEEGHRWQYSGI